MIKIISNVILSIMYIFWVIYFLFPYLSADIFMADFFVLSNLFNSLFGGGLNAIRISFFFTDRWIFFAYCVYNLWLIFYIFFLFMEKASFFYVFLYGNSIDNYIFICYYMLRIFIVSGHRIGFFYVCLIYRLVTFFGVIFSDGVLMRVSRSIGYIIIF